MPRGRDLDLGQPPHGELAHPQSWLERRELLVERVREDRHHQDALESFHRQDIGHQQHVRDVWRIETASVEKRPSYRSPLELCPGLAAGLSLRTGFGYQRLPPDLAHSES